MRDLSYIIKTLVRVIGTVRDFIFYDKIIIGKYNIDVYTTLFVLGYLFVAYNVWFVI